MLYLSSEAVQLWLLVVHVLQDILDASELLLSVIPVLRYGRVTRQLAFDLVQESG